MIKVDEVIDSDFENLIEIFDNKIALLKNNFNIELNSYGTFLRILLNNLQKDALQNLIDRVKFNRELERALDNAGGYTIDILGENNPKEALLEIINYLRNKPLKIQKLIGLLNIGDTKKTIVADINDIDFLSQMVRNRKIKIICSSDLKKKRTILGSLYMYSFNGKKDFDLLYNLGIDVCLLLYTQEKKLFERQLQIRKHLIEEEVNSNDRFKISGITYDPIPDLPIRLSQTIDRIVDRIDVLSKRDYENYREESEILLDALSDKCWFKIIFSNNTKDYLDSNETVYTANGNLLKIYLSQIKIGDKIRTYPIEHFAEKLYQVAVETEPEVFGKVEDNSKHWHDILIELSTVYRSNLYYKLKENKIRVLPATVDCYLDGKRKFPMFNQDLKAIFNLKYPDKTESEIDFILAPIRKSKTIYNSTMISLGRGIKQEIKLFLKEKRVGEILTRLRFTSTTLQIFIDKYMPLLEIISKEVCKDESYQLELKFIQLLEL